nr:AF4/FMR2 family member lilli [Drosophila suzukii]
MFVPETEDMLPRSAPRPCAAMPMGHNNEIVRPTVPEVSILFGQPPQDQQTQMQQQQQPQLEPPPRAPPTFASWKKQMLPRVNFSPILATELGPRTAPSNNNSPCSPKEYIIMPRDRNYTNDAPLSANHMSSNSAAYSAEPKQQVYQSRRLSGSANSDVLTICAGTQTESFNPSPPRNSLPPVVYSDIDVSNLAKKSDLAALVSLLESMRQEQQQLRNLCELLLEQQQRAKAEAISVASRTTASQCDILTANNGRRISPIIQDYIAEEEEPLPSHQARVIPQFQSPRPNSPMAQSTAYRTNTPQGKRIPQLAKPNTEKSLVMNELALKYLRQPVDELMKDMRLGASPKSPNPEPLRQIDNLAHSQSPNDISNASYKYLKKYRLLPEEQMEHVRPQSPMVASASSPRMQLDLENIRNQPKLL